MANLLRGLWERWRQINDTAIRAQQIQDQLTRLEAVLAAQGELQRERSDTVHGLRQTVEQVNGIAEPTLRISREILEVANDGRMHTLLHIEEARMALGRLETRQLALSDCTDWKTNEFRVYSQFGEDGLLQLLIREIGIPAALQTFVEFGVEDYREANTRFLLLNDRWQGLVLDGDPAKIAALKESDPAYLRFGLTAQAAFITRENINAVLQDAGFSGEIGLLSVDIDGNDFWVWEALTVLDPLLVVTEYNYRFGAEASVTIPYDPKFVKGSAHPSAIYYGSSLRALSRLAVRKGYALVGCCSGGVNAFFVRRDRLPATVPERTVEEAYVAAYHAEMRNAQGKISKVDITEQQRLLFSLPLISVNEEGQAEAA